ncbi:MAG: oxygen-independent coproporphyrinogen III oxidase [Parabacteroides sp.]|nr:oxygen-independent coproporphyrinogen III oxidase [Parabacteroides sp.]
MDKLIEKYNVQVPRYTSYPPANFFNDKFTEKDYIKELIASNDNHPQTLSFYFHIPYCRNLCHYCGCNSFPMVTEFEITKYVETLHKEIDIVLPLINKKRIISQIHYGGGTPTVLGSNVLKELNDHLLHNFNTIDKPEIAIECHPGWMNENDWTSLSDIGFNRFSIGVQDFNTEVLKCVNRKPSLMPVGEIVSLLKTEGNSVNLDLLYGLPYQTELTFMKTVESAVKANPDRLVTFSYAHVPWVNERQKILEQYGLPGSVEKKKMFESASKILTDSGYLKIGMDHFVKPHDELAEALRTKSLHRNFQGYCTRQTTGQVYAFGVTGITQLTSSYFQNEKNIDVYILKVNSGVLPVSKGYILNRSQQITRIVIEMLMCNYQIDWNEISLITGITPNEIKELIWIDSNKLLEMEYDGLISIAEDSIKVNDEGKLYVRNVASAFDPLNDNTQKYSKPL